MGHPAFDLTGKVALVTGGNCGIGLGMAQAVAEAGADVAIWGTNAAKNEAARAPTCEESGRRVAGAAVRRRRRGGRSSAAFAETVAALGRVDACFANAGIGGGAADPFLEHEIGGLWQRVLRVNLDGAFFTFRAAARHMVERGGGGSLVGTASLAAIEGAARNEHYAATKGGLDLHDPGARGRVRAPRHPRQRHPAGLDRDRHDGALRRRREVRATPCCRASRCGAGASGDDFGGIAVYLMSDASALPHRRHLRDRRRLLAVLSGGGIRPWLTPRLPSASIAPPS